MGHSHCSMTNQVHIRQLVADLPNRASSVGPTGRPGRPPKPPRNDTAAGPLPGAVTRPFPPAPTEVETDFPALPTGRSRQTHWFPANSRVLAFCSGRVLAFGTGNPST